MEIVTIRLFLHLLFLLSALAPFSRGEQGPAQQPRPVRRIPFRWVDPAKEPVLFAEIQRVFEPDLLPEARQDKGETRRSKHILRAGILGQTALVVIATRDAPDVPWEQAVAYNFDFETKEKYEIETQTNLWTWNYYGQARFEDTPYPDILFTFFDCTECEATRYLGAFQYDPNNHAWIMRSWGKRSQIYIGGDFQFVDIYVQRPACMFRVGKFENTRLDQAVVFCREWTFELDGKEKLHAIDDTYWIYGALDGKASQRTLSKNDEKRAALQFLCVENQSSKLCAGKSHK